MLELLPRGEAGWTSGPRRFGAATTVLFGPNGSGKTPMIKALAYALGHPVDLPPLIREKCSAVSVELVVEGGALRIERRIATGVDVTVTDSTGGATVFNEERSLSEWVLPKLGVSLRTLSGKSGDKIAPYMSVVGPMFLVDQDVGWTTLLVPLETHQFVKNQREEVSRWLLDVPVRNRPVDKSEFQEAKTKLAGIQEQIAFKRRGLEVLQRELGEDRAVDAVRRLEERRTALNAQLISAQSVLQTMSQAESALDVRVREAVQQRDEVSRKVANANRRKAQLVEVQAEVGVELGALEQNEIASEAFRALCGNEACQFFRKPEDSYGRRVLYLRDQLKDFESSSSETQRELSTLHAQLEAVEQAVKQTVEDKRRSLEHLGGGDAIGSIEAMSRELGDIHVRLDRLERIRRERQQLEALINNEARAGEEVVELRPSSGPRRDNARLLDARQNLAATFREWLLALRTPNLPADVAFDEELRLIVSGERFSTTSSHSGSTRTRLVLAYHASMVETSLMMGGTHPRLLVLDAPRQHELNAADLRAYIERFHALSIKQSDPVQLVFSTTDPEVLPEGCVDELWTPPFVFDGEPRFLGPRAK